MRQPLRALFLGAQFLVGVSAPLAIATAADAAEAPADAPRGSDSSEGLQEVIVSAQRRSERLIDVPMSVTVLDESALENSGIRSTHDLELVTPALQMQSYGGWLQPAIRGISSTGASPGDSSNVAIYLDGVYQPNQAGSLFDLPDVERVQILKGPQGALYGQNAAGGAIIIDTRAPSFTPTANVSLSYGNLNDRMATGFLSGPLSEHIAGSLEASYEDRNGYNQEIIIGGHDNGLRSTVARGKLLFNLSDWASLTLIGHYSYRTDSSDFSGIPLNGNSIGYSFFPDAPKPSPWQTTIVGAGTALRTYGFDALGNFKADSGAIKTVTSFGRVEVQQVADADYSPVNYALTAPDPAQSSFIQEINYIGDKVGRFMWSGGLFFMSSEDGYQDRGNFLIYYPVTLSPAPPGPAVYNQPFAGSIDKTIGAAWVEMTYDILSQLSITAGGRYSYERQRAYSALTIDGSRPPLSEFPGGPQTFEKFTPHANLVYKLTNDQTAYFNFSKGFKSGLVNVLDFTSPAVKPENVTGYELGYKGRLNSWSYLELSAFHYDYTDLQVSAYKAPVYLYENAAAARINGAELNVEIKPVSNLTFAADVAYLDATYERYSGQDVILAVFVPNATNTGNATVPEDVTGKPLIRAPKWVSNVTAKYDLPTAVGKFSAFAAVESNSGYAQEPSGRIQQPQYTTVAASLSYSPSVIPQLQISLWGRNLTDRAYQQSVLASPFTDGVSYAPPRTYGVRLDYGF